MKSTCPQCLTEDPVKLNTELAKNENFLCCFEEFFLLQMAHTKADKEI